MEKGKWKMSSILNKNKRKKNKVLGWTKEEQRMLAVDEITKKARHKLVADSYKDFLLTGYYLLHIHFKFANKRIIRLENTINAYLDCARTDDKMKGQALAFALKDRYGIEIEEEVNSVPSRELLGIFGHGALLQNEAYRYLSASMFNYLAIVCTALKFKFNFPVADVKKFIADFKDLINTLFRVKQFELRFSNMACCLADEINYIDERYIKVIN